MSDKTLQEMVEEESVGWMKQLLMLCAEAECSEVIIPRIFEDEQKTFRLRAKLVFSWEYVEAEGSFEDADKCAKRYGGVAESSLDEVAQEVIKAGGAE